MEVLTTIAVLLCPKPVLLVNAHTVVWQHSLLSHFSDSLSNPERSIEEERDAEVFFLPSSLYATFFLSFLWFLPPCYQTWSALTWFPHQIQERIRQEHVGDGEWLGWAGGGESLRMTVHLLSGSTTLGLNLSLFGNFQGDRWVLSYSKAQQIFIYSLFFLISEETVLGY